MGYCVYTSFCPSSFALILMGNRELVTLIVLLVSFDYKCSMTLMVPWASLMVLMVPWASLQFVIEAVPGHTHVLFLYTQRQ